MKNLLYIFLVLSFSFNLFGEEKFFLADRIKSEQFYKSVFHTVYGEKKYSNFETFKESIGELRSSKRKKILKFIKELDHIFPQKVLMPLTYWRLINPNPNKVKQVLSYFMIYKLLIIRDHIDNPLNNELTKDRARLFLKEFTGNVEIVSDFIFSMMIPQVVRLAKVVSSQSNFESFKVAINNVSMITEKLPVGYPGYLLSFMGFIPGNKVEVVSLNDVSNERIDWYNERVIFAGGVPFPSDMPYMKMPTKEHPAGHIAFRTDPIFIKYRDIIDSAKDSVFIDIFLCGGTLGGTLIKYLLDETAKKYKENPNFKVMILHDYATSYNMNDEMLPIFRYLRDQIKNDPIINKTTTFLQANIQRHSPGMAFGITDIIPKTPEVFRIMEKKATYYEGKLDHSKVIVVDANTDYPKAYFGSKNWSDHSGGYYYDDIIYVEGPAAAAVQDQYYDDVEAALTTDTHERSWFYYKDQGFGNDHYLPKKQAILDWVKLKKNHYPILGKEPVRLAQANVDGTILHVRNMLIDMIINAQKTIYMEQLFIFDPYIVSALIKRKLQLGQDITIKVLADHNGNFGMNGLPNSMYLKEMKDAGIELRARRTSHKTAIFPNGDEKDYHQENHRKISSFDSKVLLGGSSNINPDTLQGTLREMGAQLFSKPDIDKFEDTFLKAWNDEKKTMDLDIENVRLNIGALKLSKEMSKILNGVAGTIYRIKDKIERRY